MRPSLKQTVAPASEPLTLVEAKAHLRVDSSAEDDLITSLIEAARRMAEAYTQRQLVTATYTLTLDDFPDSYGDICLPRTPLGSVSSIAYTDVAGDSQTLATTVYEVIDDDVSASVVLKPGQRWPSVQVDKRHAVVVTFTAGYGSSGSDVPESARAAMLLIVGNLYENREAATERSMSSLPMGVKALLDTISVKEPV
jgi:uncharacterized phiE125 gp8 family phage protein